MRSFVAGVAAALVLLSGSAYAQPSDPKTGYIAGVAQSAFGNVTSQSFGVEGGWYYQPNLAIFAEVGGMRDTAPETLGPAAQTIAGYLIRQQSAPVGYAVKQPVAFFSAGIRYETAGTSAYHPYALAALGAARVTRDVTFTVGGNDVTDSLETYGVTLGTDLAGSTTDPMVTLGAGVAWKPHGAWIVDLGYRFSRISTDPDSTIVNRVGLGIGYAF